MPRGNDHQRGDEDRTHHRDHHEQIGLPHRDAVDAGCLPDVLVDAAQAGEHQAHDQARALPEPGDQDAVDHDVGVVERVEGEALEAEAAHDVLNAELRVEDPLPNESGDDEAEREWIQEDGAEGVLEADLLIEQRREHEADHQAEDQRQDAVDRQVLDRNQPARGRPQPLVLIESDESQPRQELRIGEGIENGPDRSAEEHDERRQDHRDRRDLRAQVLEKLARSRLLRHVGAPQIRLKMRRPEVRAGAVFGRVIRRSR